MLIFSGWNNKYHHDCRLLVQIELIVFNFSLLLLIFASNPFDCTICMFLNKSTLTFLNLIFLVNLQQNYKLVNFISSSFNFISQDWMICCHCNPELPLSAGYISSNNYAHLHGRWVGATIIVFLAQKENPVHTIPPTSINFTSNGHPIHHLPWYALAICQNKKQLKNTIVLSLVLNKQKLNWALTWNIKF